MAQERPNRIVEWYLLARAQVPELRRALSAWIGQVREEPRLLWETPAFRYGLYGTGALLTVWLFISLLGWFQPAGSSAKPEATTANYYVMCTDPGCGYLFVINRKFGFRGFPVECPKCRRMTGMAARQCHSKECKGAWVVPVEAGGGMKCPRCGTQFAGP